MIPNLFIFSSFFPKQYIVILFIQILKEFFQENRKIFVVWKKNKNWIEDFWWFFFFEKIWTKRKPKTKKKNKKNFFFLWDWSFFFFSYQKLFLNQLNFSNEWILFFCKKKWRENIEI